MVQTGRCDRNGTQRFRLSAAPQPSTQTGENAANCALSQQAQTGLEVLLSDHLGELVGIAVGIAANHASVTSGLVHISDALASAGVKIKALFGPEHGARGDVADGEHVGDAVDARLGVPVYSLYGKHRAPTPEMLDGIDVMLVDLQDVGSRFYTFLYTMANVMDACGACGVPVWVLDRPNPITGTNPEGPILEPDFASFVGMYSIAQRHGLTAGELARLFETRFGVECDLRVIKMRGWARRMWFDETGLPWVMPSPNMPSLETAVVYPGLCLLEGTNVSEGRGTVRPFELFGAPWIEPRELKAALLDYDLPGAVFREAYFVPTTSKFAGIRCAGAQVHVTDRDKFRPVVTGVAVVAALRRLYPDDFAFRAPGVDGRRHFDLLAGTSAVREAIDSGASPWEIAAGWERGLAEYAEACRSVMLY